MTSLRAFFHRLLEAMFGPEVPDTHPWAGLSGWDRKDGRK